jgi:hypothetical protein
MGGHKDLKWRLLLFCSQRIDQADDPVGLKTVLELVDQDDGRFIRCASLETGNKQAR